MKGKSKVTGPGKLEAAVDALKKKMAVDALKQHGTLVAAARELGLTVPGLVNMLRRYGIHYKIQTTRTVQIQETGH